MFAWHRQQFATPTQWVTRLAAAQHRNRHEECLPQLQPTPSITVDEVGDIPFDAEAANPFFQLVSSRYERSSVIVTSNKPVATWAESFRDAVVACKHAYDPQVIGPNPKRVPCLAVDGTGSSSAGYGFES